jgi:multiple sugar transport system permease protein
MTESSVPAAHGRRRGGAGTLIPVILLTLMAVLILLPIVFTFLYSFFPKSEITAYLKLRGNYDDTQWLPALLSPQIATIRQYYPSSSRIRNTQAVRQLAKYTRASCGQALIVPMMASPESVEFKGRDALFRHPDAYGAALQ